MDHRHLNTDQFTLAAIDNIIENGQLKDWAPLIDTIKADPFGEVANKVIKICEHHPVYGGTAFFMNTIAYARGEKELQYPESQLESKPNSWFN